MTAVRVLQHITLKGEGMNLEKYFDRIGYHPSETPSVSQLHTLTRAHVQSIPFENLDVLAGVPISLEPDAVFDKLITNRRGGYCFEHNGLFIRVLSALGYSVETMGARVRLRCSSRDEIPARTHLFVRVALDGQQWLTDVGFGGFSLTSALLWQDGLEQQTPHDLRRVVQEGGRWFHQVWQPDGWQDLYEFDGQPMHASDQKMANWYTSTHPDSTFMGQRIMAIAGSDGSRYSMLDNELRHRQPDGELVSRTLTDSEWLTVARARFKAEVS